MRLRGENKMKNTTLSRRIIFIRHGKTAGNLEKRYIGKTDEPLCTEGILELQMIKYPPCDIVICSPMLRCVQTARIIYPHNNILTCKNLCECDFGSFEGKNYMELRGNHDYTRWLNSAGTLPFPHGEAHEAFKLRCVEAFDKEMSENDFKSAAFVIHGGTIMAIMEKYALPKRKFYDYQVKNCHGFLAEFSGGHITIEREI